MLPNMNRTIRRPLNDNVQHHVTKGKLYTSNGMTINTVWNYAVMNKGNIYTITTCICTTIVVSVIFTLARIASNIFTTTPRPICFVLVHEKICSRCGRRFMVFPNGTYANKEECTHHWGKAWKKKSESVEYIQTGITQNCMWQKNYFQF